MICGVWSFAVVSLVQCITPFQPGQRKVGNLLSLVKVVVIESLEHKIIILNNSSWASCASMDRILVRMNEKVSTAFVIYKFTAGI